MSSRQAGLQECGPQDLAILLRRADSGKGSTGKELCNGTTVCCGMFAIGDRWSRQKTKMYEVMVAQPHVKALHSATLERQQYSKQIGGKTS